VLCISYLERSETRRCFITIAFKSCLIKRHQEVKEKKDLLELNGTRQPVVYLDDVS
jgi:hypothetical protein